MDSYYASASCNGPYSRMSADGCYQKDLACSGSVLTYRSDLRVAGNRVPHEQPNTSREEYENKWKVNMDDKDAARKLKERGGGEEE